MLKIIGGSKKKAKLIIPQSEVRPTSSIKREAIFSFLENHFYKNNNDLYKNKCFLDLFAGSGSLGLEGVSRGLAFCYFFEKNTNVLKVLEKNCKKISFQSNYLITNHDSFKIIPIKIKYNVSVIFIDPPYKFQNFKIILENLLNSKIVNKETITVIESDKKNIIDYPSNFKIFEDRIYGRTKISFLTLIN